MDEYDLERERLHEDFMKREKYIDDLENEITQLRTELEDIHKRYDTLLGASNRAMDREEALRKALKYCQDDKEVMQNQIDVLKKERDALVRFAKEVPFFIAEKEIKLGEGSTSMDAAFKMLPEATRKEIE